jgi:hypothetical protein
MGSNKKQRQGGTQGINKKGTGGHGQSFSNKKGVKGKSALKDGRGSSELLDPDILNHRG